ncbi:rhodanese-like domain-containing protein [Truepera radiovictrix]|uniref:Rhodanese domain protein n=1 Tax=Truepera radiovictrix (strain DSM 17093 / CIP 108686 / LMG 22925 / RQ-24) TaxID=649638 RepID=D7CXM0_TRURR|nr:rhodanese-like domain-containing protein [Truepera radiovictrix]ADI14622.1 Rhodanese domain protein [Truepera radiovictrix DSM 17093]WMT56828.1 rhodanese-like domain-containing protein [Truepera radiovictrix]
MRAVTLEALLAAAEAGAAVFDLRPAPSHLAGAVPLSLEALQRGALPDLPPETPVYLVCARGQVSELAGLYLEAAGFTNVHHLVGGLRAWVGRD